MGLLPNDSTSTMTKAPPTAHPIPSTLMMENLSMRQARQTRHVLGQGRRTIRRRQPPLMTGEGQQHIPHGNGKMKRSRVGGRCALQTEHVHALADLHREDGCSTCHEENDRSDRLTTLRHSRTREQCSTVWESTHGAKLEHVVPADALHDLVPLEQADAQHQEGKRS